MPVGPGRSVAERLQRGKQLAIVFPDRDLGRGLATSAKLRLGLTKKPEVPVDRARRALNDDVPRVVDDDAGKIVSVEPLTDSERPIAELAKEPLEATRMKKRVWVRRCPCASDK